MLCYRHGHYQEGHVVHVAGDLTVCVPLLLIQRALSLYVCFKMYRVVVV